MTDCPCAFLGLSWPLDSPLPSCVGYFPLHSRLQGRNHYGSVDILGWRQFLEAEVLHYHKCAKPGSWSSFAQHSRGFWLQLLGISHSHEVPADSEQTFLLSPRFSLCLSSTWPGRLVTGPVGFRSLFPLVSSSLPYWGSLGFCLGFCLSFMDESQGTRTVFGFQQPLLKTIESNSHAGPKGGLFKEARIFSASSHF